MELKAAETDWAVLMVTTQVEVPLQPAPLQPSNREPLAAAALRVTSASALKLAVQVEPQLMPDGVEVTEPVPVPLLATVSGKVVTTPPATVMPSTLGLSGPPPLVKAITTCPLASAVALKLRATALLAPPAAAKMSKAVRTVAPLMATLKVRWPAAVQ